MGKKIEPVVVDPASNWDLFAEKAKQLLLQDKVAVTFGCWTSVSRKSVLPVFENNKGLLFYPVQYEGEECSKNVFYTGATPNQQLIPAAEYLMSKEGAGTRSSTCSAPTTCSRARRTRSCAPSCSPRACPPTTSRRSTRRSTIRTTRRSSARSSASPPAATPRCCRPSTATATCPSTRSSPTRACAARTRRSWPSAWPRTSCAAWTPHPSSATSPRGTTTSRSTRRRTRSSSRPSRPTRRRPTCPAATSA